jgi:hypothetical protein
MGVLVQKPTQSPRDPHDADLPSYLPSLLRGHPITSLAPPNPPNSAQPSTSSSPVNSFVIPASSQRVQRYPYAQQQPRWANTRPWSYGCQCARVRDAIEMLDSGAALIGVAYVRACVRTCVPTRTKGDFP